MARKSYEPPELRVLDLEIGTYGDYGDPEDDGKPSAPLPDPRGWQNG